MSNEGAVPLTKLVELDSDVHHIREQADRDRRAAAERNVSTDEKISRIDERVRKQGDVLAGLVGGLQALKWMVGIAIGIIPISIGAAWALARHIP